MIVPSIKIRVTNIDSYIIKDPDPALDSTTLPRVPIIRVFGQLEDSNSTSCNACVHVHQVYPYIYINYEGSKDPQTVHGYIQKLQNAINTALAVSQRRSNYTRSEWRYVRHILFVKGVPFYGFHASYQPYLKILLSDPSLVQTLATILRSGSVLNTRFVVHESHLSYILQFLCDFGLYGCGWLEIGEAWLRGDAEDQEKLGSFDASNFKISPFTKSTRSKLEFDIQSHQIHNRQIIVARPLPQRLMIPATASSTPSFTPSATPEPLVLSIRELWDDERARRTKMGLDPSPAMASDDGAPREAGGDWQSLDRLQAELEERIALESGKWRHREPEAWESLAWTTFESVEMLWDAKWRTIRRGTASPSASPDDTPTPSLNAYELNPYEATQHLAESDEAEHHGTVDHIFLGTQAFLTAVEDASRNRNDEERDDSSSLDLEREPPDPDGSPRQANPRGIMTPTKVRQIKSDASPSERDNRYIGNPMFSPTANRLAQTPPGNQTLLSKSQQSLRARDGRSPFSETKPPSKLTPHFDNEMSQPLMVSDDDERADATSSSYIPTKMEQLLPTDDSTPRFSRNISFALRYTHDSGERVVKRRKINGVSAWSQESFSSSLASSISASTYSSDSPSGTYSYTIPPPSTDDLLSSLDQYGLMSKNYRDPYYSKPSDRPEKPVDVAGRQVLIPGDGFSSLPAWDTWNSSLEQRFRFLGGRTNAPKHVPGGWQFAREPPGRAEVNGWLKRHSSVLATPEQSVFGKGSQIVGPTQKTPSINSKRHDTAVLRREIQTMSVFALDVFACSSTEKTPDPSTDAVVAAFYCYQDTVDPENRRASYQLGVVAISSPSFSEKSFGDMRVELVPDELHLVNSLQDLVLEFDPDVLTGWELQNDSWGYLSERVRIEFSVNLGSMISRVLNATEKGRGISEWGRSHEATFTSTGRHVLNLWQIMRAEQSFSSYTFENNVFQLLHRRMPRYSHTTLREWYTSFMPHFVARVFSYFIERVATVMDLLDETDVITKNSEFARVFGVDFLSVLTRGSQFKVEAFMFRLAKPENFVLPSPSREDVGKQNAAECIPMIMEPASAFYKSPLLVLDFQSLYPSIMIAYNYCYSTCLGRIRAFKGESRLGFTGLEQLPGLLGEMKEHIQIAPNGIVYAKTSVRKSLLAKMLEELLETRVMVKQAMKIARGDKGLMKILDARQLGLKFIANVTYGYTSATFSGRMPCVEIADSIVESGRQTLEKAVRFINENTTWGGRVVYGDTDSLFVSLPGKTKDEAFRIGQAMAEQITSMNPRPIKLKFEKVYLPAVLMAKKRYVGFKYENPDDLVPVFDAKGIETVRRDGVPAQAKMLETCLKILFRTQDLSKVKEYCYEMWKRLLAGRVSVQDFAFAREVKLGTYSDTAPPGPGPVVAALQAKRDPRLEIYGDRVPYVITRGSPGKKLADRAYGLDAMFWREGDGNEPLRLDAVYYIEKVLIPPLKRVFDLVGADVGQWYRSMPKIMRAEGAEPTSLRDTPLSPRKPGVKYKIDSHFRKVSCVNCGRAVMEDSVLCKSCLSARPETILALSTRMRDAESKHLDTQNVCASCAATPPAEQIRCESYDCPWYFERHSASTELDRMAGLWQTIRDLEKE